MKRVSMTLTGLLTAALLLSAGLLVAQQGRMQFDPDKMTGGVIKKIDANAMTFEVERTNRRTGETSTVPSIAPTRPRSRKTATTPSSPTSKKAITSLPEESERTESSWRRKFGAAVGADLPEHKFGSDDRLQ